MLNDRAYVGYKGKNYEVDPTTFGFIKSGFEEAEQEGARESTGAEATACQKAATSLDLNEFVDNLENEGGEEVEGVETTKLSGDLNPEEAVDAIIKLSETPACSSELEAAGPLGARRTEGTVGRTDRRGQEGPRRGLRRRRRPHHPQSGRRPDRRTEGHRRKGRQSNSNSRSARSTKSSRSRLRRAPNRSKSSSAKSASTRSNCSARCRAAAARGLGGLLEGDRPAKARRSSSGSAGGIGSGKKSNSPRPQTSKEFDGMPRARSKTRAGNPEVRIADGIAV